MAKVSAATLNKQATELLNLYVTLYVDKYGKAPTMNRFKQKWGFISIVEDYGHGVGKSIIEYYFKTSRVGHPIDYLLYNYEKLHTIMVELEQDEIKREEIRKETEARVKEWSTRGNK